LENLIENLDSVVLGMGPVKRSLAYSFEAVGGLPLLHYLTRYAPRILMYHRVVEAPFVSGLHPVAFKRQLEYIARYFNVVSVEQLLAHHAAGTLKPYMLALTFDDGHSDFYETVWPLLRRYGLPATLYVPTGFIDGTHWLWPDKLRYILLNTRAETIDLPETGRLSLTDADVIRSWSVLGDYCLQLGSESRSALLERLAGLLDVAVPALPLPPFTPVTWGQLREMVGQGLDVGSHSVSHPILSQLQGGSLTDELLLSARRIKEELGNYPRGICYPNGRPQDINDLVVEAAAGAGYRYGLLACKVAPDSNDMFRVGRIGAVPDFLSFKWRLAGLQKSVGAHKPFLEY
jgi:peptidoglycan/xylan/chitin deacetylase (PgdA/CDA1 family)